MPCGKYYVFTTEMDFEGRTQGVERKCQGLQICPECVQTLTQERDAAREDLNEEATHEQLVDACMSYRHDFGLLDKDESAKTLWEAHTWWKAIVRALKR